MGWVGCELALRPDIGSIDDSARPRNQRGPGAGCVHYLYLSSLDDAGNPDYYVYIDTLDPRRGIHPYTRDKAIGSFTTPPRNATTSSARMISDLASRVRSLEGVVRAGRSAGSSVQDDRVAKLVARLVAFETWANGGGHFGTPPAVGSSTVYTEDQFVQAGDQA